MIKNLVTSVCKAPAKLRKVVTDSDHPEELEFEQINNVILPEGFPIAAGGAAAFDLLELRAEGFEADGATGFFPVLLFCFSKPPLAFEEDLAPLSSEMVFF